jgi:hypothetical protein
MRGSPSAPQEMTLRLGQNIFNAKPRFGGAEGASERITTFGKSFFGGP